MLSARVFQSTLRRTERLYGYGTDGLLITHFNPRSDERSDMREITLQSKRPRISIHAPTNGATTLHIPFTFLFSFQSTLRRTERLKLIHVHLIYAFYFNPRSDERSDITPDTLC